MAWRYGIVLYEDVYSIEEIYYSYDKRKDIFYNFRCTKDLTIRSTSKIELKENIIMINEDLKFWGNSYFKLDEDGKIEKITDKGDVDDKNNKSN